MGCQPDHRDHGGQGGHDMHKITHFGVFYKEAHMVLSDLDLDLKPFHMYSYDTLGMFERILTDFDFLRFLCARVHT